jgi:hypothetical protein
MKRPQGVQSHTLVQMLAIHLMSMWFRMTLTRVGRAGSELPRKTGNVSAVASCGTKVEKRSLTRIMKRCYRYPEAVSNLLAANSSLVATY